MRYHFSMKIFLVLLLFLPSLSYANCGDCDSIWEQLEKEKQIDKERHGCRSCLRPIHMSPNACPPNNYECYPDWPIITNVLSPDDFCRCSEAKCAGNAKLAVDGEITTNKFRCNNSQWTVDGEVAENVVCAKSCDKTVCRRSYTKFLPDFRPLNVTEQIEGCAIGNCDENGMSALKEDGTFHVELVENEVTCTGDGKWKERDGAMWKYVMCNVSPCGPAKCKAFTEGAGMASGEAQPLHVAGHGIGCATAVCPGGYVLMDENGNIKNPLTVSNGLKCDRTGSWIGDDNTPHPYVMCKQPPCQSGECTSNPFSTNVFSKDYKLINGTIRKECGYSCSNGQSLFMDGYGNLGIISVASAVCDSEAPSLSLEVGSTIYRTAIGCASCDQRDGQILQAFTNIKPSVANCVVSCKKGYDLQYRVPGESNSVIRVPLLLRRIWKESELPTGDWVDYRNGRLEDTINESDMGCVMSSANIPCRTYDDSLEMCNTYVGNKDSSYKCEKPETAGEHQIVCPSGSKTIIMTGSAQPIWSENVFCDQYGQWRIKMDDDGDVFEETVPTGLNTVSCTNMPPTTPIDD